jgi:ribosomal protein L11 methyltransferase
VAEPVGWRVVVEVDRDDVELVSDHLFSYGALGIEEREAIYDRVVLLAGMADAVGAEQASAAIAGARVEPIHDDGWADEWRAWARPVRVADVVVQPAWLPVDAELADGAFVVTIDPGRTFGSGAHETTQLALAALLDHAADDRVLDVGCGSGVLGIAAAVARRSTVMALDIDELAVEATRANASRNGVAPLVHASSTGLSGLAGEFDVVVANILAVTLRELAGDFARVVAPRGVVLLSGMLDSQVKDVDDACAAAGMHGVSTLASGDWRARAYVRSAPR